MLGHYRVYESLFIVDLTGTVMAATRDERLEDWMMALLPANAAATATIVSPIRTSTFLRRPTWSILQPIAPGLEGRGRCRLLRRCASTCASWRRCSPRTPPR